MKLEPFSGAAQLRQQAEVCLNELAPIDRRQGEADIHRLLQELQMHQIELKMQNEALINSQQQIERALSRYADLYEYSPVGYFTLKCDGVIAQTNLFGANLLGMQPSELPGKHFGGFVAESDLPVFINFLQQIFTSRQHQKCEAALHRYGLSPLIVQIQATPSPDSLECNVVVVDITGLKQAALLKQTQQVARVGGWEHAVKTGKSTWTEEVYRIFEVSPNYDPSEPRRNLEFFTPEDRPRIKNAFKRAITHFEAFDIELQLIGARGTHKWIKITGLVDCIKAEIPRLYGDIIDITDRKLAEQALLDSELFVKATIDAVSAHICVLDRTGRILAVNQAWRNFFDKNTPTTDAHDYCVNTNYLEICDAASPSENCAISMAEGIRQVINDEIDQFTIDYPCHSPTEQRWFIARVTRFQGNSGNVVVVHENITERKQLEEDIRRRDQYQRAILDNIPCLAWLKDEESRFLAVNTPFALTFGSPTPEALIGKDDFNIAPESMAKAYRADDLSVLESGVSKSLEEAIETSYGQRWFETYKSPVKLDGRIIGTAGFARDITQQKLAAQALMESEDKSRQQSQRLAEVIWGTNSGTWEWNVQTGEAVCNERWAEIIGYTQAELSPFNIEIWRKLIEPDDVKQSDLLLTECFTHQTETYECELRIRHKAGHWVWVLDRGRVVAWSPDGQALRMSGTYQDITARKAAEAALKVAKAEAERANNAKSRFLAAASHDLRQPLSALGLYVGVLKNKGTSADASLLNNMASCVSSLNELLTDLLDLSKLDAGVVRPNVSTFSVPELIATLISVHSPEAQLKGLSLRWLAAELTAHTDPVLYKRLLGNLIANAIRYTEHGGVLVACRRQQGKAWIEIWDTGSGIPADKTSEIFEEFRQLGHDERNRGSGLGLAIVAKSAALLGLQIRLRSRLGKGSMFAVELPLGVARAPVKPRKTIFRALRIALVEDNAGVLNALVCALEVVGHQVIAAPSGEELLQLLVNQAPDIVISDFRLAAGKTGFDVIAAVRKTFGANLPALLITGDTDPKLMRSMADRGILVQHKPVDIDSLQLCISQATNWN